MRTLDCEHLSTQEFLHRLHSTEPGEHLVYAKGHLAETLSKAEGESGGELRCVAAHAFRAQEDGLVRLTQHKIGRGEDGVYEYRATKRGLSRPLYPVE